jgi:hypothetical protein
MVKLLSIFRPKEPKPLLGRELSRNRRADRTRAIMSSSDEVKGVVLAAVPFCAGGGLVEPG